MNEWIVYLGRAKFDIGCWHAVISDMMMISKFMRRASLSVEELPNVVQLWWHPDSGLVANGGASVVPEAARLGEQNRTSRRTPCQKERT